jgi:hypothetical protein
VSRFLERKESPALASERQPGASLPFA